MKRFKTAAGAIVLVGVLAASSALGELKVDGTIKRTTLWTDKPIVDLDDMSIEVNPISIGQMGDELTVPAGPSRWAIAGGPCFKLKLNNKNDHVIRLTNSVIKLIDNAGTMYDVMGKADMNNKQAALIHETNQKYNGTAEAERKLIEDVKDKIDETRVFEPKAEILPGFTGVYYLFFDLPRTSQKSAQDNADWLQRRGPFKLMIFDVITKTDAAGNTAKKTKYEWSLTTKTFEEVYKDGKLVSSTAK